MKKVTRMLNFVYLFAWVMGLSLYTTNTSQANNYPTSRTTELSATQDCMAETRLTCYRNSLTGKLSIPGEPHDRKAW